MSWVRWLIFPVPPAVRVVPPNGIDEVRIADPAGEVLALHSPAPEGAPTLVLFHGNGEQLWEQVPLLEAFRAAGLGGFAVEYPGYGGAPGKPSEVSIFRAANRALEHLRDTLRVSSERTVLVGQSLGTAVAVEMVTRGFGARLVLISPFTSIPSVAARMAPGFVVRLLVRDRFDTASKAARIEVPTLICHGDRDMVVPVEMGRALARAIPGARYEELRGAGHNDVYVGTGLLETVIRFARSTVR